MNRTVKLSVKGNSYDVEYPNTGQQIDIELLKAKIADGNYDALRFSSNPLFQIQADKIDMIATFTVLVPKLKDHLNVKSFFDLTEEQSDELLQVYSQQLMPWYIKLKEAVRNPKEQVVETPFNSPQHRSINQLDVLAEFVEDQIYREFQQRAEIEVEREKRHMNGEWLQEQQISAEESQDLFDKINISKINEENSQIKVET